MAMKARLIRNSAHLLTTFLLTAAVALTAAPAAKSDNKEALASLEKSIVFLQTQWSGSILVPPSADAAGEGYWTEKLKYSVTCTGWYASASAQIVTAGHCVDPGQGRLVLLDGYLHDQKATSFKDEAYANWRVEGAMGGSPPDRSVRAIQPNGVDGASITSPTTVEVVDVKAPEAGDIALLHVPNLSKPTPGLVIAQNAPQVGDPVTSIGFPGDLQDIADQSQIARASFKTGTISSNQVTPSGVVQIEVSTELAPGMSGGPTVNKDGQVIGVNSRGLTTQAGFNFITNTPDLRSFLMSHNVTLVNPPAPPKTQSSMQWYVIGAAVLIAAAVVGLLLLVLLRRRHAPQFAGAGGAPIPGYPTPGPQPGAVPGWMPGQPPGQTAPISGPPPAPTTAPPAAGAVPPGPTPTGSSRWGGGDTLTTPTQNAGNFCGSCGAAHSPEARFCPQCGKPLS
jgi:serine protease Do